MLFAKILSLSIAVFFSFATLLPPTAIASTPVNSIIVGNVTSSNPNLWLDINSLESSNRVYVVSTEQPNIEGIWQPVNQFCSILTVNWLQQNSLSDSACFRFRNLENVDEAANILIGFENLDDQVNYAVREIRGTSVNKTDFYRNFESYTIGTRIWLGNDRHVIGAVIVENNEVELYEPQTGGVNLFNTTSFLELLQEAYIPNVFVVAKPLNSINSSLVSEKIMFFE